MGRRWFNIYSWIVLGYTVLVILWGATVRITGSGAGCGSHWPTCNGVVVPLDPSIETIIEFSHRLTSGLSLVFVLILAIWAFRLFPKGHSGRTFGGASLLFIIVEALVGAVLVLLELVGNNDSSIRAMVIALHQANTFLLLGCLAAVSGLTMTDDPGPGIRGRRPQKVTWLLAGFVGLCLAAASGAVVALGDTLFPSPDLLSGIAADFDPSSHFLIRLRIWHPLIAVFVAALVVLVSRGMLGREPSRTTENSHFALLFFVGLQIFLGVMNLLLLAPVWLQLAHLLVADLVLITYSLLMIDQLYRVPLASRPRATAVYNFDEQQLSSES